MKEGIQVFVTDDHPIIRDGIYTLLIKEPDIEVVGEAANGTDLLNKLPAKQVDVLILDLSMPGLTGLEVIASVRKAYPHIKIIIYSSYCDKDSIFHSIKAGASGFLPKDAMRDELVKAIRMVYAGQEFLSQAIPNSVLLEFIHHEEDKYKAGKQNVLTNREIEILRYIAEGLQYKEIGEQLFISARTVETHKNNIMNKLNLNTTVDLVKYAIKQGLIQI